MENSSQLDTTCKGRVRIEELITVDEILEQATRQYNILLEENRWIIAKKKGAGFNANNNEPSAQTDKFPTGTEGN